MAQYEEGMRFLPVAKGNKLVATDLQRNQRKGMDNDDDYFDEIDPNRNVVAKYYTWHHMSIYPPQKVESEGWRKYDLDGKVIASGSRSGRN